ncbi:MAG TPA: MFS transporter [Anaeromyxobacteraceae bacterium]|nr:MFS transporter [Anaeromyxobacteraceae bacterium]
MPPAADSTLPLPIDGDAREAPPGGAACLARPAGLFALGLAGFSAFLGVYATQPLLPMLERVFGVSKAAAALTVSAPTVAVALASPFFAIAARRFGHRAVIGASLLALPVPMLLAATSPGVPALVAWRFLQGLVVPGVYAVTMAFIAEAWPAHRLGQAMATLVTGNVIGGFSGRVLSGFAAEADGWRASFVVLGIVTAIAGVTASRLLPRVARPHPPTDDGPTLDARALLGEPRLLATFAVGFNVLFTLVATFTYVTFHLAAPPFGLGTGALSAIFTVYLVGAVVTPLAGRWIDKVGSRRAISIALAGVLAGLALTLAQALWLVVLGLAAVSSAVFVSQSASTAFLRTAAPARVRTVASGLYVTAYYFGGAVGGVAPALSWRLGGWRGVVTLLALVQVATLAIAQRHWRSRAHEPVDTPPGA